MLSAAHLQDCARDHLHGVIELLTAAAPFTDGDAAGLKVAEILQSRPGRRI